MKVKDNFIKETNFDEKIKPDNFMTLMENIENIKRTLAKDYNNMQYADDRDLVDYYTYKIKAEEAKYDYLIREAKRVEKGLIL